MTEVATADISMGNVLDLCIQLYNLSLFWGRKLVRRSEHRAQWRLLGETYVKQWTNVGL